MVAKVSVPLVPRSRAVRDWINCPTYPSQPPLFPSYGALTEWFRLLQLPSSIGESADRFAGVLQTCGTFAGRGSDRPHGGSFAYRRSR